LSGASTWKYSWHTASPAMEIHIYIWNMEILYVHLRHCLFECSSIMSG
jgi:hypothetical protein